MTLDPNSSRNQSSADPVSLSGANFGGELSRQLYGDSLNKTAELDRQVREFQDSFKQVENAVGEAIVGLREEMRLVIASVFMGGHVLMEGIPGLAKTRMVKSVAEALGLEFSRIQFTPDLLPGDITGSLVQTASRQFEFNKGPIFANVVLADEINRTGPKTQAALLECMQEMQVTVNRTTHPLPSPFIVLATQNPLESAGTYPLPDAQLDRFALKICVNDPNKANLKRIWTMTTSDEQPQVPRVFDPAEAPRKILEFRDLVRKVVMPDDALDNLAQVCIALRPGDSERIKVKKVDECVAVGPSPRGGQSAILLAKVYALLEGRTHVVSEDLRRAYVPALRHRVNLQVQALSDEVRSESIIEAVVKQVHT